MLTSTGLGSGLDIDSIVTAIVDAERVPLMARVDARRAEVDTLVSGFGLLQTQLEQVRSSLASLADASQLNATQASSSDTTLVDITASSAAQPGFYSLSVSTLALRTRSCRALFLQQQMSLVLGRSPFQLVVDRLQISQWQQTRRWLMCVMR